MPRDRRQRRALVFLGPVSGRPDRRSPREKVREDESAYTAETELPAKSTPDEIIDSALSEISAKLESDLLSRIYRQYERSVHRGRPVCLLPCHFGAG
jgi:hypothetical protein